MSSLRSAVLRVAAVTVPLAITLLVVEGALHLMDFPPKPAGVEQDERFVQHDTLLGWRNVPGLRAEYVTQEYRTLLAYNQVGMRGEVPPTERRPGTRRVLLIGDSFVDGYTVPLERRVAERLERQVTTLPGTEVEIIAHGVKGYSTDQELLWLEHFGLAYRPDVVVLMFYSNDVWYNTQAEYTPGIHKPYFELEGDSLALRNVPVPQRQAVDARVDEELPGGIRGATRWFRMETRIGMLLDRVVRTTPALNALATSVIGEPPAPAALPDETLVFHPAPPPSVEEAWDRTEALLRRMRDRVLASGAELVVFYVPHRSEVQPATAESDPLLAAGLDPRAVARELVERCTELGIPVIDPVPEFRTILASSPTGTDPLYFLYDWHWTARGHEAAASILARSLPQGQFAAGPSAPGQVPQP